MTSESEFHRHNKVLLLKISYEDIFPNNHNKHFFIDEFVCKNYEWLRAPNSKEQDKFAKSEDLFVFKEVHVARGKVAC